MFLSLLFHIDLVMVPVAAGEEARRPSVDRLAASHPSADHLRGNHHPADLHENRHPSEDRLHVSRLVGHHGRHPAPPYFERRDR